MTQGQSQTGVSASDVTVVMPAFNEGAHIGKVVADLRAELPDIKVLVVDDGSCDNTGDQARAAGAQVITHRRNMGYGAALRTGIHMARTGHIAMYDADGQHRPCDLAKLMATADGYDMVVGTRGKDSHREISSRPGKWFLGKAANMLAGRRIPDLNSGLRVIRRKVILRYLHLLPQGFSASTTSTICLLQRGYDVTFVPITTVKRQGGKSTVKKFGDGFRTIQLMVRLIILFNPQRFFLPPALLLIAVGTIYGLAKAVMHGQGIPQLAVLLVMTGLITGLFGLLAEQISTLRLELFEKDQPDGSLP